jgi:hypothetical protein
VTPVVVPRRREREPGRPAQPIHPVNGTADDVAALYRAMAGACEDIAREREAEAELHVRRVERIR